MLAVLLIVIWLQVRLWLYSQDWTGFGPSTVPKDEREKTLWDWLDLLIVPTVLALGLYWFNREERQAERKIADDRLQENALQGYFDKMTELTLEQGLHREAIQSSTSTAYEIARRLARARTLAILPRLNGVRKGVIIRFLWETGLITSNEPIVNLRRADLSEVQLQGHSLEDICLAGATLNNANLSITILNGADLSATELKKANLTLAHVIPVANPRINDNENSLEFLRYYVREGYMRGDFQVNLSRANLSEANLEGAVLYGVNLEGATLRNAKLWRARLDGAGLTDAKVTDAQLKTANSLYAATMPDGSRYDGRFNLAGDIERARSQGVNTQSQDAMQRWYAGEDPQQSDMQHERG